MAEAGRIKHHIANNIENPLNAILIVGYATPFSLAGQLTAGNQEVKIFGEKYQVFAEIHRMNNFSAHADWKEMIQYLSCQEKAEVKTIFLVHGEEDTLGTFKSHILDAGFKNVQIVEHGIEYNLN
jgi:metallo-beta-lactamase family protein